MMYKQPDIRHTLNEAMDERIKKNRLKLTSIFETVLFCGRNNIALRGHRDNATDVEKDTYTSETHPMGISALCCSLECKLETPSFLII